MLLLRLQLTLLVKFSQYDYDLFAGVCSLFIPLIVIDIFLPSESICVAAAAAAAAAAAITPILLLLLVLLPTTPKSLGHRSQPN